MLRVANFSAAVRSGEVEAPDPLPRPGASPPPEISENSLSSTPDRPRLIPMARVKETCFPFILPAPRTLFTSSPLAQKFL